MDPKKTQRLDAQTLAQINERDRAPRALDYVPARLTRVMGPGGVAGDEIKLELTLSRMALLALVGADITARPSPLPAQAPQPQDADQRSTAMITPHDLERALSASTQPELDAEATVSFGPDELLAMGVSLRQPEHRSAPEPRREDQKTVDIRALVFERFSKPQGEDQ